MSVNTLLNYKSLSDDELIEIYINATDEKLKEYNSEKRFSIFMKEDIYEGRCRKYFSKQIIEFKEEMEWQEFYPRIISLLKLIKTNPNSKKPINIPNFYCSKEKLMELKILHKVYNLLPTVKGANYLAGLGNLYLLEWLEKLSIFPDEQGALNAIRSFRRLDVLNWLEEHNIYPDQEYALKIIIKKGNIKVLNWYAERNILPDKEIAYSIAIDNDKINSLKWLIEHNIYPTSLDADRAVDNGNIEILDFLETQGILPSKESSKIAQNNKNEETINWIKKRGII